ncbi:MAG: trypsin-like peptidase domain-containing protein [Thermoleophilia bacterium]|nr:trypsin-like peptidase domain-containing protein [Thermoleophilia bacterium]
MGFTIGALTLVLLMSIMGYRRGGIVSLMAIAVMALGAVLVAAICSAVFGSDATAIGAIIGAVASGVVFGLRSEVIEQHVSARVGEDMRQFDHVAGAFMSAAVASTVIWLVAADATLGPNESRLSVSVRDAVASRVLLGVVPPTGNVATAVLRSGLAPSANGPTILVDFPSDDILFATGVVQSRQSVVRIEGRACTTISAGSGWVIAPRFVITNAHVVAGMKLPGVLLMGNEPILPAVVRAFDPVNDLAVLYVPTLVAPPLKFAVATKHSDPTAVIGFPKLEGLSLTPARFDRELTYGITDIYDHGNAVVPIVLFRGDVRPGNSGSPMVNAQGEVVATIAAHALNQSIDGGFAVPNSAVQNLFARLQPIVSTGPCIEEQPLENAVTKQ